MADLPGTGIYALRKYRIQEHTMKILVIGPSDTRSRGGMATVINGIRNSSYLNGRYDIDIFESFIDGSAVVRLGFSVLAFVKFLFIYRKYDLFHIHVASYGSTFRKRFYMQVLKRAGKKVIVHIHGAKYLEFYKSISESNRRKMLDFLKQADMVIALSDEWKKQFEEKFGLVNCVSLPNGIDTEAFECAVIDPEEHSHEFAFLGRLGERKGAYDLVKAVKLAAETDPEIKVYMAGDGEIEEFKRLRTEQKLENNIEILGWIGYEAKLELLKKTAVLVLPSYNEGLPMAILEGMAAGKAVISTTVGAIPEVVKPENGIIITPGDVEALKEALLALSGHTDKLKAMSENNVKKINDSFSTRIMHERLAEYYDRVMQ